MIDLFGGIRHVFESSMRAFQVFNDVKTGIIFMYKSIRLIKRHCFYFDKSQFANKASYWTEKAMRCGWLFDIFLQYF